MAAACAMVLSWDKEGPRVSHVKQANKAIQELQKTADATLRILPISLERGFWMSISDASVANDGSKSQGGFLIAYADKEIVDGGRADFSINSWRSHRLRRMVKASLGSEALAMDDALAELEWVRALFSEVCIPGPPFMMVQGSQAMRVWLWFANLTRTRQASLLQTPGLSTTSSTAGADQLALIAAPRSMLPLCAIVLDCST